MDEIKQKIKDRDPWYVDFQIDQVKSVDTKRSIRKRWNFIICAIDKFRKENKKNKLRILDAGCGDGVNLAILTKILNVEVYGVDYNPLRVKRAKKNFPTAKIIQDDLTNLKIDKTFDIILCSQVLEHIREDNKVLKDLYDLLEPTGILVLGTPNEGCFLAQLRNKIIQPYTQRNTDHINFYKEIILREKIKKAGFQIKDVMYEGFFFPHSKIDSLFSSSDLGFNFANFLRNVFKTQVAGYYFLLEKNFK
ncbi:methyltransferase [subsurface metagenome]